MSASLTILLHEVGRERRRTQLAGNTVLLYGWPANIRRWRAATLLTRPCRHRYMSRADFDRLDWRLRWGACNRYEVVDGDLTRMRVALHAPRPAIDEPFRCIVHDSMCPYADPDGCLLVNRREPKHCPCPTRAVSFLAVASGELRRYKTVSHHTVQRRDASMCLHGWFVDRVYRIVVEFRRPVPQLLDCLSAAAGWRVCGRPRAKHCTECRRIIVIDVRPGG